MASTAHEIPRIRVTVLQVVLSTMLTAAFNYAALWTEFPKGEAIQGPRLTIEGRRFACIDIVNYGVRPLGTVRLAIPAGTKVSAIQASEPIQMWQDAQLKTKESQLVSLAGFPARSATRLLVPLQDDSDTAYVANAGELGLSARLYANVEWRQRGFDLWALITAVSALTLIISALVTNRMLDKNQKKIQGLANEGHELRQEFRDEVVAVKKTQAHTISVLARRLAECHLELDFWRDTIRSALGSRSAGVADRIISSVTKILGTYSTQDRTRGSMNEVVALAEILAAENAIVPEK
jgi:hypothetical protein